MSWIKINGGVANLNFKEWLDLDIFEREAIKLAANKIFKEQEDRNNQLKADLEKKLENQKEYQSPFSGIPKPSFLQG